jgi:chromate transporter
VQETENTDKDVPISYKLLNPRQQRERLQELALVFLRLGTIAFGGPAAHIAMMDQELVSDRRWLSQERFLDLIGVTNLIPGPNSTELAIHIGYERAGWRGLIIAGSCFILPAMLIVWAIAAIYVQYQTLPQMSWLLYGIKPVIIAIILQAVVKLGKKAAKSMPTIIAGVLAIAGYLAGVNEILMLVSLGVAVMLVQNLQPRESSNGLFLLPFSGVFATAGSAVTPVNLVTPSAPASWSSVFLIFLKIGSVLYGGGYVLLAFLQRELVEQNHWLTSQQLLDAVAIGQITPGPLFTTATFVGYLLAGNQGAIAGTVGIFLPAFVLILLVNPWVNKLRQSRWASGFLDGVNVVSLGLMAGVLYTLTRSAVVDWATIVIAVGSAIAVFKFKINSAWLVLGGGAIGLAISLFS